MRYDNQVTGRVLRELREERGLSQEVVSGLAGIARTHLTMIENGTRNPKVDTLWRICEVFDVPVSKLLAEIEKRIRDRQN